MIKKYGNYLKIDKEYTATSDISIIKKLSPNVYRVEYDPRNEQVVFVEITTNHDTLVNLPGTEYESIINDVDLFLSESCREKFKEVGLLHKFNILLYGQPGGGKSCIVNRVAQKIIENDGIVLFNPDPGSLKTTFDILDSIQPETTVLIILEELDEHIKIYESELLNILDGEIQKKNTMYIATTNFIEKIPPRIRRPGRFSSVVKVGYPNETAREAYLSTKLNDKQLIKKIVEKTKNFTIDELKEVVRGYYCMNKDLDFYIQYISNNSNKDDYINNYRDEEDDFWQPSKEENTKMRKSGINNFLKKGNE